MLRNVALTGPYGHAGQFADLEGFIDHYAESADKLRAYGVDAVPDVLLRGTLLEDNKEAIIATRDPVKPRSMPSSRARSRPTCTR